ncbi:hypothetical protein TREMEDRAFT_62986 [Tremella mesenterica DSM 1558]|uniref:uncharacterized protein n=1 Tax=Tremella mesenterica (strain ATCC 24925 / CBS 8224 / DSM 1558 / NBRC 9311 / NRRL Y-6157 / RJB 2259-6 / UBC 559-6) TaxID=578456 RepID=UPI0003F49545|nr:uncharacterized protein TREMEDRAFT_62986 [Tremella mesenterica DSM 1558]EIW68525.1 hypothetical protein TREMEDRAFT_62986 [Tremella mesenterica DSM 1558]
MSLSNSTLLSPSLLSPGTILPTNTHVSGTVNTIWGDLLSKATSIPRIAIKLKCQLLGSPPSNVYTSDDSGQTQYIYLIKLVLLPKNATIVRPESFQKSTLAQEMKKDKKSLARKSLTIQVDHMEVISVMRKGNIIEVEIMGEGERWVQADQGEIWKILTDVPDPSEWFLAPTPPINVPVESRLKPITDLPVPALPTKTTTKNKRPSPAIDKPMEKKARVSPPEAVQEEAKTVVRLGPPGRAVVEYHSRSPAKSAESVLAQPPQILQIHEEIPPAVSHNGPKFPAPRITPTLKARPEEPPMIEMQASTNVSATTQVRGVAEQDVRGVQNAEAGPSRMVDSVEDLRLRRREAEETARREGSERLRLLREEEHAEQASMDKLRTELRVSGIKYTPLGNTSDYQIVNLIGIVIDVPGPPKKTKAGDWQVSLVIGDPTTHDTSRAAEDMVLTLFRKTVAELPIVGQGTPMLFRNMKLKAWNGKLKGNAFTGDGNTWAWLEGRSLRFADQAALIPSVSKPEIDRLMLLQTWWRGLNGSNGHVGGWEVRSVSGGEKGRSEEVGSPGGNGQVLLSQVREGMFFDGLFKIIHVIRNTSPNQPPYELYVSDGTISSIAIRNFHNIYGDLPPSAVHSVAIKSRPPPEVENMFVHGNVLKMANIRAKTFRGEMELIWSEHVTIEQAREGWKARRCNILGGDDERVKVIESRIKHLKRIDQDLTHDYSALDPEIKMIYTNQRISPIRLSDPVSTDFTPQTTNQQSSSNSINGERPVEKETRLATHLRTIHTDPIAHPLSTLEDILGNGTVPNRFRVRARVKSVHPRGLPGGFTLPVVIADEDANGFLPPLPPISTTSNPNDQRKTAAQLRRICAQVDTILLGPKMDGLHSRPLVEWTIQTFLASPPRGQGEGVVVGRVFGMWSA